MAKVLKNYKPTDERFEEFPIVAIRYDDEVFLDLPICAVDFGRKYNRPVLFTEVNKIPAVVELAEVPAALKGTKVFHFKVKDDSKVEEVAPDKADIFVRLPEDTNVKELVFMEGQILREEITEVIENGTV
jgi:hypothetical protein